MLRNEKKGKKVLIRLSKKYGEIYGHQARRQIEADEEDKKRVVNMREKRLQAPWKKQYKGIMIGFPSLYINLRLQGKFGHCGTQIELGLD
jgi:hypothetical protein